MHDVQTPKSLKHVMNLNQHSANLNIKPGQGFQHRPYLEEQQQGTGVVVALTVTIPDKRDDNDLDSSNHKSNKGISKHFLKHGTAP